MIVRQGPITAGITADMKEGRRVKINAGNFALCGANERGVGTMTRDFINGEDKVGSAHLHNETGTRKLVANAAIAQYGEYEDAADGKIAPLSAGTARGIVLQSAAADGDKIECAPY